MDAEAINHSPTLLPLRELTAIVVDDDMLTRLELVTFLAALGCKVVAEGAPGNDVLTEVARHGPDLVILGFSNHEASAHLEQLIGYVAFNTTVVRLDLG